MKLRTLFFTALLGFGALAPLSTAEAGHRCERTRVTYDHCGRPIHWVYRVVGRDCHGCPIYKWVRTSNYASSHHSGHSQFSMSAGSHRGHSHSRR